MADGVETLITDEPRPSNIIDDLFPEIGDRVLAVLSEIKPIWEIIAATEESQRGTIAERISAIAENRASENEVNLMAQEIEAGVKLSIAGALVANEAWREDTPEKTAQNVLSIVKRLLETISRLPAPEFLEVQCTEAYLKNRHAVAHSDRMPHTVANDAVTAGQVLSQWHDVALLTQAGATTSRIISGIISNTQKALEDDFKTLTVEDFLPAVEHLTAIQSKVSTEPFEKTKKESKSQSRYVKAVAKALDEELKKTWLNAKQRREVIRVLVDPRAVNKTYQIAGFLHETFSQAVIFETNQAQQAVIKRSDKTKPKAGAVIRFRDKLIPGYRQFVSQTPHGVRIPLIGYQGINVPSRKEMHTSYAAGRERTGFYHAETAPIDWKKLARQAILAGTEKLQGQLKALGLDRNLLGESKEHKNTEGSETRIPERLATVAEALCEPWQERLESLRKQYEADRLEAV